MFFITRYLTGLLNRPVSLPDLHVAAREIDTTLTRHDKTPLCRAGTMNAMHWRSVEINPHELHSTHVCQVCIKRLRARGIDVQFFDTRKAKAVSSGTHR